MTVVLDTSVLVAAFTPDIHSAAAESLLNRPGPFVVTDWAAAEFSAAIRIKVRQGVVRQEGLEAVEAAFDNWTRTLGGRHRLSPRDAPDARAMVIRRSDLRAPDALHIVVAARLAASLATFDHRQAETAMLEAVPVFAS